MSSEPLTRNGFRAWISSADGTILPMYEPTISGDTAMAWIAGQHRHSFSVNWEDMGTGILSASYIYLDGVCHPGRFLPGSGTTCRSGARIGSDVERRFIFLDVNEPTTHLSPGVSQASRYGQVELVILHVRKTGLATPDTVLKLPDNKQGFTHPLRIAYGGAQGIDKQPDHTYSIDHFDPKKPYPVAKFVFQYRPIGKLLTHESLVELGVAPASNSWPSPELLSEKGKQKVIPDSGGSNESFDPSPTIPEPEKLTSESSGRVISSVATPLAQDNTPAAVAPAILPSTAFTFAPTPPWMSKPLGKSKVATPRDTAGADDCVFPSPVSPALNLKRTRRTSSSDSRKSYKTAAGQSPATAMQNPLAGVPGHLTPEQVEYFKHVFAQHSMILAVPESSSSGVSSPGSPS
ncbi:hypothetical protein OF83DRAFT_1168291 [Amylostereum chailletii]|nr:hypothetical protein OF83DRAFT_1168291 [Amylostereum chailletii]